MKTYKSNTIIIGSGAAGYTAAIYTARANMNPVLVNGQQPGGQMTITTDVENYPGFKDVIQGPWLMDQMKAQAESVGTKIINDTITECNFKSKPFELIGDSKSVYYGKTVIIATGAVARWLGIESEEKFKGYGVSACATCDGFFFKNKIVAVVGGGNTAVEEALYLTLHAKKVLLIHRRGKLRAEKILQDRLFKNPKIEVVWDSAIKEILGNKNPKKVTGISIVNKKTNKLKSIGLLLIFIWLSILLNNSKSDNFLSFCIIIFLLKNILKSKFIFFFSYKIIFLELLKKNEKIIDLSLPSNTKI